MKTNVAFFSPVYTVNRKKRKVHCLLEFEIDLSKIPGIDFISNMNGYNELLEKLTNKYTGVADFAYYPDNRVYGSIIFKSSGIATCSLDDKFDESLGEKIASTRAQKKAFLVARDFYQDISNIIFNNVYGKLRYLFYACNDTYKKCDKHEKNLFIK
jgi:hypothetical protein